MKTPEERFEMTRQQVIAKIHWDARDQEVLDWLHEHHRIVGAEADRLLAEAHRARRRAIRQRAFVTLICSALGIALVAGFFFVRYFSGVIFIGVFSIFSTVFAIAIGITSVAALFRSLVRLVTGETSGSVD